MFARGWPGSSSLTHGLTLLLRQCSTSGGQRIYETEGLHCRRRSPCAGAPGPAERLAEATVRQAVEGVLIGALHPRTAITVVLQVRDSSTPALALKSLSCMALMCPVHEGLLLQQHAVQPHCSTYVFRPVFSSFSLRGWLLFALSCMRGAATLAPSRRCWRRTAGCSHARCARRARRLSTPRCHCRARSVSDASNLRAVLSPCLRQRRVTLTRTWLGVFPMVWMITLLPLICTKSARIFARCMLNRATVCCK